jgi:hypothetical protein
MAVKVKDRYLCIILWLRSCFCLKVERETEIKPDSSVNPDGVDNQREQQEDEFAVDQSNFIMLRAMPKIDVGPLGENFDNHL